MAKEYIERYSLVAEIAKGTIITDDIYGMGIMTGLGHALNVARAAPAADVVEVVWKPVLGFEGLYEVSSLGRVRNKKGETLKQGIKRTNGTCYKTVSLWKDGSYYRKYIHRMIAEAFIPNPDNLPMINHKDEDGTNNFIDNLEWCTRDIT